MEDQVVVASTVTRDRALDLDSILCLENRTPIGKVFFATFFARSHNCDRFLMYLDQFRRLSTLFVICHL